MAIEFSCSACGKRFSAKDDHAGRRSKCPVCGHEIQVPLLAMSEPDISPVPIPPPISPPMMQSSADGGPADEEKRRPFWKDPIVVIGAAVPTLIMAVFFAYLAWPHIRANRRGPAVQKVAGLKAPSRQAAPTKLLPAKQQALAAIVEQPKSPAPPPKKDEIHEAPIEDPHPSFLLGDEAILHINGDEALATPGIDKAGIVTADSIVLTFPWREYGEAGMPDPLKLRTAYDSAYVPYVNAIKAGDPDGVEVMIERGSVIRVKAGTKVRVVEYRGGGTLTVPCDDRKSRDVRITDGEYKGKVVTVPARNLRPIPKGAATRS